MTGVDPDALATGLIRVRSDGTIAWLNRSAADLLGRSPPYRAEHTIASLAPSLGQWLSRLASTDRALYAPEAVLDGSGQTVDAYFHWIDSEVVIELHPVAERVRQREMAERADRQQALTLLSRSLAHELRNPLAGVSGAAQLITARSDDATTRNHAGMIRREVERITALIERFAGGGERQEESVNLHRVLVEATELIQAEQHGETVIDKDLDPSIPDLIADSSQLHQVFLNLMRNSVQAGAGLIRLQTRIEHHCALLDEPNRHAVRIDIDDDGSGVPLGLRDRLFLPLISGRDQGSGFGLAIVQQIIRAHGGLVEFTPLESGSRFRIHLPLLRAGANLDE